MTSTHPAADVLPLLVGEEFDALVLDIRANGLRDPIILHPDGSLLDGRNRERACARAGIAPRYETWDGEIGTEAAFVISVNIRRRHLSVADRAAMAAQISNLGKGRPVNRPSGPFTPITIPEAAKMFDVSERSVKRARADQQVEEPEKQPRRQTRTPQLEAKIAMQREKAKHVNALVAALGVIAALPDGAELIAAVSAQQREPVKRTLPVVIDWLTRFQEKWNERTAA